MQHVDRKPRKEKKHGRAPWIAAAALLLAGSVAAALLLTREPEPDDPESPVTAGILINRDADELDSVTVTQKGYEPWTLIRG